jgi:hypothetical protein
MHYCLTAKKWIFKTKMSRVCNINRDKICNLARNTTWEAPPWRNTCRACSTNRAKRNAYRIFLDNPERKSPLGRPERRWVDNIKIDLREIGWDGVDWIDLAQDRDQWRALVNTVMNLRVP